jgi:hypothetical protein
MEYKLFLKRIMLWDTTPCSPVKSANIPLKLNERLPDYTALHFRRQYSPLSPLGET